MTADASALRASLPPDRAAALGEPPVGARPRAQWLLATPWVVMVACWPATLLAAYYLSLVVPASTGPERFVAYYLVAMLVIDSAICVGAFRRATVDVRALLRLPGPPAPGLARRAWVEIIQLPFRTCGVICALIALTALPGAAYYAWRGSWPLVAHGLVAAAIAGACELTLLYPILGALSVPLLRHVRAAVPALRLDAAGAAPVPRGTYFAFGLGALSSVSVILVAALIHAQGSGARATVSALPATVLSALALLSMAAGLALHLWQAVLLPARRLAREMAAAHGAADATTQLPGDALAAPEAIRASRIDLSSTGDIGLLCEQFDDMVDALSRSRTRLEHGEALLRHSQRFEVMGTMAAGFVHEIANPLTGLVTSLELASGLCEDLPAQAAGATGRALSEALADAALATDQMTFLLRDMRAFGRAEAHGAQDVSLADIMDTAIRLAGGQLSRVEGVERDYLPCGAVRGSPQKLTQVFLNLLLNAEHALRGRSGGRIRVALRQVGAMAEASVSDNGAGIPATVQGRIFEAFFTTKPEGQGTGLGLHTSQRIVIDHGGQLEFRSRPGEGTTFVVRLPTRGEEPA